MRQNCSFREIGIFSEKNLKNVIKNEFISKTTHAIRISLWHITVP